MSRHDKVIAQAREWVDRRDGSGSAIIGPLIKALEQEIAAHDKTREQRNKATELAKRREGAWWGLEQKLKKQEEGFLTQLAQKQEGSYDLGFDAGVASIKEKLRTLIDDE